LNDDAEVFAYAAGARSGALGVMLATQTALKPEARRLAAAVETIGGGMIADEAPAAISARSRDAMLAALDAPLEVAATRAPSRWPAPLDGVVRAAETQSEWRTLGRSAKVLDLRVDDDAWRLQLLEVAPGAAMPQHTHEGEEATLVVEGAFTDESGRYASGDLVFATSDLDHKPIADASGPCVCLIANSGAVRLTGPVGRWLNRFVRL